MASFDPDDKDDAPGNSLRPHNDVVKFPFRRIELSIKKFIKVLDIDLDRLHKHTVNITRLTNAEDWNGLHKEQINASRTIQQIKANIREIEKARTQVNDEDVRQFDEKVLEVKVKAVTAMEEFLAFVGLESSTVPLLPSPESSHTTGVGKGDIRSSSPSQPHKPFIRANTIAVPPQNIPYEPWQDMHDGGSPDDIISSPYGSLPAINTVPAPLMNTSLHVVPENSAASASWEQLQENIVELNELVHHFATEVERQGEVINTIEDNIEEAHINVKEGVGHLATASKYKAALYPVVGAVVGGVVAGPVGLLAGAKLGGLAGAVGGTVGYVGGRYVKKRQQTVTNIEMSNLSDRRSVSLPEMNPESKDVQSKWNGRGRNTDDKSESENNQQSLTSNTSPGVINSVTDSILGFFSFSGTKGKGS